MNVLKYKDWLGSFEYEPEDDVFHGRVLGTRDTVHFSGRSVDELKQALAESVEDYLELCESVGKAPEQPYPWPKIEPSICSSMCSRVEGFNR